MRERGTSAEAELVEGVARGRESDLATLYDLYARLLYSLTASILDSAADAEEVLQEVFLQVWRDAKRYDPARGSVYRWLVTLTRSRAIDRYRSRRFKQRRDAETALEAAAGCADQSRPSPLDAAVMAERAEAVRGLLAGIPEEQRRVMHLAYYLGHSQSEIARLLGIPLGTVKTRMRQALIALQSLAGQEAAP